MKTSKRIFKLLLLIAVSGFVFQASSCGEDEPSPQDVTTQQLTADTWEAAAITRRGVDVSSEYDGFTVNFTDSGYTTTNGGSAWPASGSWAYQGTSATTIIRDGDVVINLTVSDIALTMDFTIEEEILTGRTKTVSSSYRFSMDK